MPTTGVSQVVDTANYRRVGKNQYDRQSDVHGDVTWLIATDGDLVAEGWPGLLARLGDAGLTVVASSDGAITTVS